MLKMHHNFYTVANAIIFAGLGTLFALSACYGWNITIGDLVLPAWLLQSATGLAFIMAYSGLRLSN